MGLDGFWHRSNDLPNLKLFHTARLWFKLICLRMQKSSQDEESDSDSDSQWHNFDLVEVK